MTHRTSRLLVRPVSEKILAQQEMRRPKQLSQEQDETYRRRRRRHHQQIEQLEATVARQASEMAHLVSHLRRVKPKRPRMSATRSIWIAGKAGFKCQGDRSLCPCWLLAGRKYSAEKVCGRAGSGK